MKDICDKTDCKNKNSMNCIGCKWNKTISKQNIGWDSYNNKFKTC